MCTTDKVRRNGKMDPNSRACMLKVRKMVLEFISGLILPCTKATGSTIRWGARELIHGTMAEYSLENGSTIICMVLVCISGLTAAAMRANTAKIWDMERARSRGVMAASTKANGRRERCTAKVCIRMLKASKLKVYGLRAIGQSLWTKTLRI